MKKKLKLILLIITISMTDLLFRELLIYNRGDDIFVTLLRCFSSSFVHWDNSHLFWNMFALLLIGVILIDYSEKLFWLGITIPPLFIGLTIHFLCPKTLHYCGFSGVAFTLIIVTCGCLISSTQNNIKRYGWLTLTGVLAKTIWELAAGTPLFAQNSTFFVQPESHLAGSLAGIVIYLVHLKVKHAQEKSVSE